QDDADAEVRDHGVELRQQPADGLVDRTEDRFHGGPLSDQGGGPGGRPGGTCVRRRVRDRVEPTRVPRVTTTDTTHREPGALRASVTLERLEGVRRARRVEPAPRREPTAHEPPG